METLLEVVGTSQHDGAPAAAPRHARASAMLDCGVRCSQHQSVAELSVHGKSQRSAGPPGNVSPTDELPRVWSVGPSACPSFAAVLLHDVLPDLSPGVVSPTVRHPSFAAIILGWQQALAPGRQRSAAHARQSPRTHVCRVQPSILPPSLPLSSSCLRIYTYVYTCGKFTGACFKTQQLARVMLEHSVMCGAMRLTRHTTTPAVCLPIHIKIHVCGGSGFLAIEIARKWINTRHKYMCIV